MVDEPTKEEKLFVLVHMCVYVCMSVCESAPISCCPRLRHSLIHIRARTESINQTRQRGCDVSKMLSCLGLSLCDRLDEIQMGVNQFFKFKSSLFHTVIYLVTKGE